jgi:hypothetical protein
MSTVQILACCNGGQGSMQAEPCEENLCDGPTSRSSKALIAVVGVDVEAEDGVYFNGLCAAHGRAKLPAR